MTVQVVAPGFENKYPRRGDRLQEEPTAKNAQGLFPPDACIFVGKSVIHLSLGRDSANWSPSVFPRRLQQRK
jgi:hypothetical protein